MDKIEINYRIYKLKEKPEVIITNPEEFFGIKDNEWKKDEPQFTESGAEHIRNAINRLK